MTDHIDDDRQIDEPDQTVIPPARSFAQFLAQIAGGDFLRELSEAQRDMVAEMENRRLDGAKTVKGKITLTFEMKLDGGVFEVHILNAGGLISRCKAALSVVTGSWRQSGHLESFTGEAVTLIRRDKRRGHITFDGEVERKAGTLAYRLLPKAVQLIAARPAEV